MNLISIRCDDNLHNGDDDDNVDEFNLHNLGEFCCVFEIFLFSQEAKSRLIIYYKVYNNFILQILQK